MNEDLFRAMCRANNQNPEPIISGWYHFAVNKYHSKSIGSFMYMKLILFLFCSMAHGRLWRGAPSTCSSCRHFPGYHDSYSPFPFLPLS